jgi:hypothetical protein
MSNYIDRLYTDKESFLYVLDSRNGTAFLNGSYNSSIHFDLNEPIKLPRDALKLKCCVVHFQAPNSLYNVNYTNNKIVVNGASYNIPYGNYNANNMISTLLTLLPSGFSISINNISNIYTFTYTQSFTISGSCGSILGFSNSVASIGNSITMPYTCNFNGLQSFNIHFSTLITKNIDSLNHSPSSIIQSIPIEGNPRISYVRSSDFEFTIYDEILNDITIDLKDDVGNYLNFNNQNWNMTLEFTIIRDIDRFPYFNSFQHITNGMYYA